MFLPLLCLPVLVAGLPGLVFRQDNAHHLPLVRRTIHRRGGAVDLDRITKSADYIRYKYGLKSANELGRRAKEANIGIINQGGDTDYHTSIVIGTPSQSLDVVLDTGSSDLWVAIKGCTDCPTHTPEFDTTQSSTLNASSRPVILPFGSGVVNGTLLQDTVSLGPFTVPDQVFTGATQLTTALLELSTFGLLGLGFQSISVTGATPLWQALVNAGELSSPEMSFFLTRFLDIATITESDPGGTFTLGGTNSSLFKGDIEFNAFPNGTQPGFWFQTVSGLTVNGNPIDIGNAAGNVAAIDTGTSLLGGPKAAVQAFWAQVNGSREISGGMFEFPCTTNISSTLSFGGTAWPISAADMNLGEMDLGFCLGALFALTLNISAPSGTASWVVGDTFLKNVYTVFRAGDSPAVGFAELADGLNI